MLMFLGPTQMLTRYLFRFNHSCKPNTEYFWNTDFEVFDLSWEFFNTGFVLRCGHRMCGQWGKWKQVRNLFFSFLFSSSMFLFFSLSFSQVMSWPPSFCSLILYFQGRNWQSATEAFGQLPEKRGGGRWGSMALNAAVKVWVERIRAWCHCNVLLLLLSRLWGEWRGGRRGETCVWTVPTSTTQKREIARGEIEKRLRRGTSVYQGIDQSLRTNPNDQLEEYSEHVSWGRIWNFDAVVWGQRCPETVWKGFEAFLDCWTSAFDPLTWKESF